MSFFQSKGWSKEQAAGIVGNLQVESGKNLKTNAVGDRAKHMGLLNGILTGKQNSNK
jgi:hypothetical protein